MVTTALDGMTLTFFTAVTLTYIGQLGVSVVLGVLREQVRHALHVRHERAGHVPPEVALRGHQGRVEVVTGVGHTARWGAFLLAGAVHARDAARHSDASGVLAGPPGGPSVHGGLVIRRKVGQQRSSGGQTGSRGWGGAVDGDLRLSCGDGSRHRGDGAGCTNRSHTGAVSRCGSLNHGWGSLRLGCGAGLPSSRAAPTPLNPPPPRHT